MTDKATPTLRQRCDTALQSLPDAPYKTMLAVLFDDMTAEVERLAAQAAPTATGDGWFTKRPITIQAYQWFKNGDHPEDYAADTQGFENGELRVFTGAERKANGWEGSVVRYYRHPDVPGDRPCEQCGKPHHVHGWIDTLEQGHRVCPGDWIITGVKGERYPCKPDIFATTYAPAAQPSQAPVVQAVQTEVRFKYESMKPIDGYDAIYAEYATTFGRYPDDFMSKVVRQTKEDLFMWWGAHREKIRAGLVLLAAQEDASSGATAQAVRMLTDGEFEAACGRFHDPSKVRASIRKFCEVNAGCRIPELGKLEGGE